MPARRAAVRFQSNIRVVNKFIEELNVATVKAAALVVERQAKMEARGGFKSGAFVTRGWQSIRHEVERKAFARSVARVGSTEKHFMWWEVGHHNRFTRRYERNQWLTRAMTKGRTLMQQEVLRAAEQVAVRFGGHATGPLARAVVLGNLRSGVATFRAAPNLPR